MMTGTDRPATARVAKEKERAPLTAAMTIGMDHHIARARAAKVKARAARVGHHGEANDFRSMAGARANSTFIVQQASRSPELSAFMFQQS